MTHPPIPILAPMLVEYLGTRDVINLSSVNRQFRNVLSRYVFPSFANKIEVNHRHWSRATRKRFKGRVMGVMLSPPRATATLDATMPLSSRVLAIPSISSLVVDHGRSDPPLPLTTSAALLINYNRTGSPLLRDPGAVSAEEAKDPQTFFERLIHLKITSSKHFIVDPGFWSSISFNSLVSLTIPLYLGGAGTREYTYMVNICKALSLRYHESRLKTLTLTDNHFRYSQLEKYSLHPILLSLISGDCLPFLATFRFPLVIGLHHEPYDGEIATPFHRRPLFRQLIRASAKHAVANSRGTPWRLGISESSLSQPCCTRCTLNNCMCNIWTPKLTAKEYEALLKIAHHSESYIRVPDFFHPYLTVTFTNIAAVRTSFNHPAALTPLTAIHLFFPPPISSSFFNNITRLTIPLPIDEEILKSYQPHLTALPRSFPVLTHLKLWTASPSLSQEHDGTADVPFPSLTLPPLNLHTLDISARVISKKGPCGHSKLDFGKVQAEWLILRDMVVCSRCWNPRIHVGTKGIVINGMYGMKIKANNSYTDAWFRKKKVKLELAITKGLRWDNREVILGGNFVYWL